MEIVGTVLVVAVVVLLWAAAAWFGRDSRDGRDGFSATGHRRFAPWE